jgi:RNA polymerase sigma-70 factor (ECF subfamily)
VKLQGFRVWVFYGPVQGLARSKSVAKPNEEIGVVGVDVKVNATMLPLESFSASKWPKTMRNSRGHVRVPSALATDDITLVERVRTGDQRAFKLLVERYQRKVFSIAVGMLKDKEDARDVSQEAFVKVYRYIEYFKGDASFYTWLYRITVNLCIDAIRKKGSAKGNSHVEFDEGIKMDMAEANIGALGSRLGTNPQKSALRAELADRLTSAIGQIPETHRQILLLREVEGMSYEDLSRTLKIPKGTVMSRLFHARLKMQKLLNEYLELDESTQGVGSEDNS